MATTAGKWETVGKPSKIPKKKEQSNGTSSKKSMASSMITLDSLEKREPVKETPTIYDAFIEKEKPSPKSKKQIEPHSPSHKKATASKKKPTGPEPRRKLTLEEALKKIDYDAVQAVLAKDQATFPDNPTVWLMDLATYINCNLDSVPESHPVFEGRPKEYPLSAFPKSLQNLFEDVLKQCSEKTQRSFMEACIKSMINDMKKGISTYGFRFVIQLLARMKPNLVAQDVPKYLTLIKENQSHPLRCLAIMWALAQSGYHSMQHGLTVWFELMLPFLNIRSVADYVVDYIGRLFKTHQSRLGSDVSVSVKQFFPLLDIIFNPPSHLSGNHQKKLSAVYPKIKAVSLQRSSKSYRMFFPSFLARLTQNCKPAMKQELCSCLIECLVNEPQCFSVWRQMYTQHLMQTRELLIHINQNWGSLKSKLDRRHLQDTLNSFMRTNAEMHKTVQVVDPKLLAACKELDEKLDQKSFSFLKLFVLVIMTIAICIGVDIYVHSSFRDSKTRKLLSDVGLLVLLENALRNMNIYSAKMNGWLQKNAPYYYAKVSDVVGPYLALFWQKFYELLVLLAEVTAPARAWVSEKAVQCLQWLNAHTPWLQERCTYFASEVWTIISHYALLAWSTIQHYTFHIATWLQTNVFTGKMSVENISAVLQTCADQLRQYVVQLVHYVSTLVKGQAVTSA